MSLGELLQSTAAEAIALALLHFLWQGAVIAGLVAGSVWLFRVRRSTSRYAIYLTGLLAMAACPIITAALLWLSSDQHADAVVNSPTEYHGSEQQSTARVDESFVVFEEWDVNSPVSDQRYSEEGARFSDDDRPVALESETLPPGQSTESADRVVDSARSAWHDWSAIVTPWILPVWLIGVVVCSCRLWLGWLGVEWWIHRSRPAGAQWNALMQRLAGQLSLRRLPRLAVSDRVPSALAARCWRPVILIPAGWLINLPSDVVEAVLAHELAHIRRNDVWINVLQRVIETLLFFHPAVWWLSNRLRSERELCCDEMAVAVTGHPVVYARALELVARTNRYPQVPAVAAGLGGERMMMLKRIRQILGNVDQRRQAGWWSVGLVAAAIPLAMWMFMGGDGTLLAQVDEDREEFRDFDDEEEEERERRRDRDRDEDEEEERERRRDREDDDDDDDDEDEEREGRRDRDEDERERAEAEERRYFERRRAEERGRDAAVDRDRHRVEDERDRAGAQVQSAQIRELIQTIQQLREEVQALRREVNELRERRPPGPPIRRDGSRPNVPQFRPDAAPREGDRPRREGDRPDSNRFRDRPDQPPREGDRPRREGGEREGDRPRPESRDRDRPSPEARDRDRPRREGEEREGDRPRSEREERDRDRPRAEERDRD